MAEPWQDTCPSLSAALTFMMKKEIIVDTVFKRGKVPCLYAHRLILSMWSPYFADLMRQSDKSAPLSITFSEDVDVMEAILGYIYSSSDSDMCFTKMPVEKLIQAIEITERFSIMQLHQRCMSSLQRRKIYPTNVIQFLDYGLRKNFGSIVQKCIRVLEQQGISEKNISSDTSVVTILALLTIDKIALESEATLLSMTISWLSYPANKCYKSEVLSYIDLSSIEWNEYEIIWKTFPNFFSESELCSLLSGVARHDITLFPKWYERRMSSTMEKSCDVCVFEHMRLAIPRCCFLKWNYQRNLREISQSFCFSFQNSTKARLVNATLNFGPREIPENEFKVKFSKSGVCQWKECSLHTVKNSNKYIMSFQESLVLKPKDNLNLKFSFRKNLVSNNIKIVMPNIIERQKISDALQHKRIRVEPQLSKLAFFCPSPEEPRKYLVSSFCVNFCDQHATYLVRKRTETKFPETTIKMEPECKDEIPKLKVMDIDMIKVEEVWID